jgi:hypothetical protein
VVDVRSVVILALAVLVLAAAAPVLLAGEGGTSAGGMVHDPIDPEQQTAVPFGTRSHWHQPWRAYLDTVPATALRDAIGINFNVEPAEAEATARMLAQNGFRRARIEVGWSAMGYDDPGLLRGKGRLRALVGALDRHGIRPLVLLNAHHGEPCPVRRFTAELAVPAAAGSRSVRLTAASARQVVPGRSGLDGPGYKAAGVLLTGVSPDGTATLSRPLPQALRAGGHAATTLRFEPFGPPRLADGRPNPRFEETLVGWLRYAEAVVRDTRDVLGHQRFDVEIWNELTFGSDFLDQGTYYQPAREQGSGSVTDAILRRTVAMLRKGSSPAPGIGIGNGFANQTPFAAGSTSPPGLTAIDKHPYYGMKRFPRDSVFNFLEPLDALGRKSYRQTTSQTGELLRRDRFVPRYEAFFPEYILTAIQTETLIRDLSPITTSVSGVPHGRRTHPRGSAPPTVWITEANLDPTGADPSNPRNPSGSTVRLTRRDVQHLQAKAALRYYTSFVNKGASAVHLFAVKGGATLSLVSPSFFERLRRSGGRYPGADVGGPTPRAVRRLVQAIAGAMPLRRTRPLSLIAVSDRHDHFQFRGNGTRAHPILYDRDVTTFFPFQVRPGRWIVATYVMTRNLAKLYRPQASGPSRYDMPAAPFRLTIGGLEEGPLEARATDPLTGRPVPVRVVERTRAKVVVELPLTDSPRLIVFDQR